MNFEKRTVVLMEKHKIEKMIESIKAEEEIQIQQILAKNEKIYKNRKEELLKEYLDEILVKKAEYDESLKKKKMLEISKILYKKNLAKLRIKNEILNGIIEEVKLKLKNIPTNYLIIKNTVDRLQIDVSEEKNYIAFCRDIDDEVVKIHFSGTIKKLPEMAIGGLLIMKKDGSVTCDNTYLTKLEYIIENKINILVDKIFK